MSFIFQQNQLEQNFYFYGLGLMFITVLLACSLCLSSLGTSQSLAYQQQFYASCLTNSSSHVSDGWGLCYIYQFNA